MSKKITIDQEIENIKQILDDAEVTHQDYLGPDLKEIQNYVLSAHARTEKDIEILILLHLKEEMAGKLNKEGRWKIQPLLEALSYRAKLELIEDYYLSQEDKKKLIKPLLKVNSIRIEFAHPKGMDLRNKYTYQTIKGKQNIRNLFRALKQAQDELRNYFSRFLPKK